MADRPGNERPALVPLTVDLVTRNRLTSICAFADTFLRKKTWTSTALGDQESMVKSTMCYLAWHLPTGLQ